MQQVQELLNEDSDDEEIITKMKTALNIEFIALPPDRVDALSDTEDIDEDAQVLTDQATSFPNDIVGEIEVQCEFEDEGDSESATVDENSNAINSVRIPKWTNRKNYEFSKEPVDLTVEKTVEIYAKIGKIVGSSVYVAFYIIILNRR